jgi:hypothetical protein
VGARPVRLDGEYDYFLATELAPEAVAGGQLNMEPGRGRRLLSEISQD